MDIVFILLPLHDCYNVTKHLLLCHAFLCTKYNMSDRIVSDRQCRAEGEKFCIRYIQYGREYCIVLMKCQHLSVNVH